MLYNDAYRPMLGHSKHPVALGARGRDMWPEIWHVIGPMLEGVLQGAGATWSDNQLLLLHRNDYLEECYFTFSYSPIVAESGAVGGVFTAVYETTEQVIGERRLRVLRLLGDQTATARTPAEACARSAEILGEHTADIPFALIYLLDPDGTARLVGRAGIGPDHPGAPLTLRSDDPAAPWSLDDVRSADRPVLVPLPPAPVFPGGSWDEAPQRALVLPLAAATRDGPVGILVAGLSPRRAFDERYSDFLRLVAGHVATAVANATAYDAERRRAEALAELDRAKTVFFSNVSHEFRTPLTLQLAPLEDALQDAVVPLPAEQRERIELAHRNSLRLLKLVNTLLDFSRIEAGRAAAAHEPTDLTTLTADLASTFRSAVERGGLRYVIECAPLGEPVYVDRDMWEKIVLNLLSNAFKFTLAGEIRVTLEPIGREAVLTVADTGTGIPAAELPHLFERFHRVRNTSGRTREGTGIGLALVHELVRLHGGRITVASEERRGSSFRVAIPLGTAHLPVTAAVPARPLTPTALGAAPFVEEALRWDAGRLPDDVGLSHDVNRPGSPDRGAASAAVASSGTEASARTTGRARILLVDDNADMRTYIERLLGACWTVEAVGDGRTALARARTDRPDLVLCDVMMPGLSGFELLAALRGDPAVRDLPVILLSARAGEEARVEGLQAGADDYLVKPFGARELLARVGATLSLARLRAETAAALQASETRYRSLAEATTQIIWSADPAGRFNAPSASWETFTGQRWEDYRGFGFTEAIHPEDRAESLRIWNACLERCAPCMAEYRLRRADGRYCHVQTRGVPVRDAAGRVVEWVGTVTDIEEQRVAEARLRQAAKMEAIGRLAGGLAHDFNNQLQAVAGFARFIERDPGLSPTARADLEEVQKSAERMASLTRQLLAFSRQQVLTPETLELASAVVDARPLLQRLIGPAIDFRVETSRRPVWVRVDRAQLLQVLLNLTINARDAMPEGGRLVVGVSTESATDAHLFDDRTLTAGNYAKLTVTDTGAGIPPEYLPHIFEPFFTTKGIGEGTGLGLATVHGIVTQSQGHVSVESTSGIGTRFTILFPVVDAPTGGGAAPTELVHARRHGSRVLVVDDEAVIQTIMRRILEADGYDVLLAANGRDALACLEHEGGDVDLVLSDVVMPVMGGAELGEMLAVTYPDLPVAWMSGYPRDAAFRDGRSRDHQPFLRKPVVAEELLAVVRNAVRRRCANGDDS